MKVLQINKLYYPHIGGVEKHVQDVAQALHGRVDVEVLVANDTRKRVRETVNGVAVTRVPSWGVVQSAPIAPGFYREIRKSEADIYHLHFPDPIGEIAYLAAGTPGKLVVTYHADLVRQQALLHFYGPVIKRLLNRADMIMASSPNLIKLSPWLADVKDKCRVVPFAIDLSPFQPNDYITTKAREIRENTGSPLILFVGRLVYYKGLEWLIHALPDVKANLVIVGEGVLEPDLKKLAAELNVADRVHFVGAVSNEDLPAYYHACDLLALPSIAESEAFGFVQLEAHACGKPVVSTDLPTGVPYANLNEVTGLIVPPKNSQALAAALNRLLEDETLRRRLGKQAKNRVETEFSLEAMAREIMRAYTELCPT